MIEKVIVTNETALRAKYGVAGWKSVEEEVRRLVAADEKRGLASQLVRLDQAADMAPLAAPVVQNASSPKHNKLAIDGVWKALKPDYLMILGGPDVVPHQILRNPVGGAGGDDDATVPSDLPYASDAPFAREIEKFLAPTRVVSRLPNVTGDDKPAYLLRLLRYAQKWQGGPPSGYATGFVLTAAVWKGSTRLSARRLFAETKGVNLCPPKGPVWPVAQLGRRAHFINCHGAPVDPQYYGQGDEGFPVAHRSSSLGGLREGTVAAVECCYGAELFDPEAVGTEQAIANAYLAKGAYGFLGSTNIAYGPADENGSADLMCQYFMRRVQSGASLGRAALEARQEFVEKNQPLDPVDLKTLGQFCLLGDPSIQPVKNAPARPGVKSATAAQSRGSRRARRRRLVRSGREIARHVVSVVSVPDRRVKHTPIKRLAALASKAGLETSSVRVFTLRAPKARQAKGAGTGTVAVARVRSASAGAFHVMIESKDSDAVKAGTAARGDARVKNQRIIIVREVGGRVTKTRELYPR